MQNSQAESKRMQTETLDFGITRPPHVRIMVCQITSDEDEWVQHQGLFFLRNPSVIQDRIAVLLAHSRSATVDAIVFPELSVPVECLGYIQAWSQQNAVLVIAGSHYHETPAGAFISRCPVIVNGQVHFVEKITPSPIEVSPIAGEGLTSGTRTSIFMNTPIGNFAILICSDYLDDNFKRAILDSPLDFLIVPAFQAQSDMYHSRMSIDCEGSEQGIYLIYANNICGTLGDGRSAFFGLLDRIFHDKLVAAGKTTAAERYKVCELSTTNAFVIMEMDLDHKQPFAKRTVYTRPNIRILETGGDISGQSTEFVRRIAHNDNRYARIEELFVPPAEYPSMLEKLEARRLLFIIGDPGIGKTYSAVRLLKHYFSLGYDPIWYAGLEKTERVDQRQILEGFRPKNKQVIYFEDPFGRTVFERRDSLFQIFGPLSDHLQDIDARIVITSRRQIFEQFTQEMMTSLDLSQLAEDMNVVKPSYSNDALREILRRLAVKARWFSSEYCRDLVEDQIRAGRLNTPLAIRDFAFSTENIEDSTILLRRLQVRDTEATGLFAQDIESASFETKLTLSLVFLFGTQSVSTLAAWFNSVAAFVEPQRTWAGPSPFFREIRTQSGYRIEQYGNRASVLRFIHSYYEEAFVKAAEHDPVTKDALVSAVKLVARTNLRTAMNGLMNQVVKYPVLVLSLLENMLPVMKTGATLSDLSYAGMRLIGVFDRNKNPQFFHILMQFIILDELAKRISVERDVQVLGLAFRLAYNLGERSANTSPVNKKWRKLLNDAIDWQALFSLWSQEKAFSRLLEPMSWASKIGRGKVRGFINAFSATELAARFNTLTLQERSQFLRLTSSISLDRAHKKTLRTMSKGVPRGGFQDWLFRNPNTRCGIVVDDGAFTAMSDGYNLLPVGVIDVLGDFGREEAIPLLNTKGETQGIGIVNYSSAEIEAIKGKHSSLIEEIVEVAFGRSVMRSRRIMFCGTTEIPKGND